MNEFQRLLLAEFAAHRDALDATEGQLAAELRLVLDMWEQAFAVGGKILLFGNGGSAADAQHIAAELVVRYRANRAALPAIALTTDTSVLTAAGNDYGYESVFARQVEALGRPGDVAVGISTSGRSPNVLRGLAAARAAGLRTVGFCGHDGGAMHEHCDALLCVPAEATARIQEMHILLGHVLCAAVDAHLRSEAG